MPFTSGSRAAATKLYSFTVVMPEVSGASAPFWSCFNSSLEKRPADPLGPMAP